MVDRVRIGGIVVCNVHIVLPSSPLPIAPQVPGTQMSPVLTIPYIAMVKHVLLGGINIRNVQILDQDKV
jgi:hypothetical protein